MTSKNEGNNWAHAAPMTVLPPLRQEWMDRFAPGLKMMDRVFDYIEPTGARAAVALRGASRPVSGSAQQRGALMLRVNTALACCVTAMVLAMPSASAQAQQSEVKLAQARAATAVEPGVNSSRCKRSEYNCSLNIDGRGQRIRNPQGGESWEIDTARLQQSGRVDPVTGQPAIPVLDGNGKKIGLSANRSFTLNVGQKRSFGGAEHVFALSTGLKAGGWVAIENFNLDSVVERAPVRPWRALWVGVTTTRTRVR